MYSSVYGGIILDPAMMVIPIDYHMVHRGHGVFDTSIIFDGNGKDQALTELAKIISNTTYIVSSAQCTTNHITVDFVSSGNKTDDFLSSGHITAGSVNSGCITIDFLKSGCITFDFITSGRITTRTIQEACCWT
ncbi:hypothetical protein R3W88_014427 [Solanum pinnatisectum]|uniref:Uncharacterized protein n=1 Tax=Solanum pinnatisectum TaxID=50273 RepID=A0AAV9KU12_9SOLN|nr:hypothetical protein R3W88_014427 [Solanum pinnatisectum]